MDARITCTQCGAEFDDYESAVRHVDTEHPEVS